MKRKYLRIHGTNSTNPTGPAFLPLISSSSTFGKLSKALGGQHKALCYLSQKYKTNVLGLKLGNDLIVAVLSFDAIRTILRGEEYIGRPNNFFVKLRSMGTNKGNTHVMCKIKIILVTRLSINEVISASYVEINNQRYKSA